MFPLHEIYINISQHNDNKHRQQRSVIGQSTAANMVMVFPWSAIESQRYSLHDIYSGLIQVISRIVEKDRTVDYKMDN